jgi:hypothetical protein
VGGISGDGRHALIGLDMSLDMHLGTDSEETVGSDGSDPLAVGVSGQLGKCRAKGAATTAAYVIPPSEDPSCRPPEVASSHMASMEFAGSGADPALGSGHLMAGSEESPIWSARWRCAWPQDSPMNVGSHWGRLWKWCCESQRAPWASSSFSLQQVPSSAL